MDCSMPGSFVLHYLSKFAQIHVHWADDAIQSSHPLASPSPPALNFSQHQGLFQWVDSASGGQSIGASASASVLPKNIQGWFSLGLTGLISLQSKGLSRVFSNTTSWKHQFFSIHVCKYVMRISGQRMWPYETSKMTGTYSRLNTEVLCQQNDIDMRGLKWSTPSSDNSLKRSNITQPVNIKEQTWTNTTRWDFTGKHRLTVLCCY